MNRERIRMVLGFMVFAFVVSITTLGYQSFIFSLVGGMILGPTLKPGNTIIVMIESISTATLVMIAVELGYRMYSGMMIETFMIVADVLLVVISHAILMILGVVLIRMFYGKS